MAESIDFQFPMKKACGSAIQKFCSDVPHNHARVIRCLQDKLDDAGMPAECKKEVEGHAERASQDYRCVLLFWSMCSLLQQDVLQHLCVSVAAPRTCQKMQAGR